MSSEKVAIICRSFATTDGEMIPGGAERVVLQISQYFRDRDVTVEVHQRGDIDSIKEVGDVTVVTHKVRFKRPIRKIARKVARDGADVLLFQEVSQAHRPKSGTPGMRIIGINHGIYWDYELTKETAKWLPLNFLPKRVLRIGLAIFRRTAKWREIRGVRTSDLVITFDTGLLRIVQSDYPHLRQRIQRVLPYSDLVMEKSSLNVDEGDSLPLTDESTPDETTFILVPRNYSLSSGLFWLKDIALYLSQLAPNLEWQIRVAGKISATTDGEREIIDYLRGKNESRYEPISNRIEFLGFLRRDELARELESASIVLIPTFAYEGACLAAVEAISYGKTVVATNVGGLNDTVINGINGILCEPNPLSIASRIAECLLDRSLLRMSPISEDFWSDFYSMQSWYRGLDRIFDLSAPSRV